MRPSPAWLPQCLGRHVVEQLLHGKQDNIVGGRNLAQNHTQNLQGPLKSQLHSVDLPRSQMVLLGHLPIGLVVQHVHQHTVQRLVNGYHGYGIIVDMDKRSSPAIHQISQILKMVCAAPQSSKWASRLVLGPGLLDSLGERAVLRDRRGAERELPEALALGQGQLEICVLAGTGAIRRVQHPLSGRRPRGRVGQRARETPTLEEPSQYPA
mmetsp:Transcript_90679/g.207510  ORF Transcript_90679/g.207510 Transcript_90679/m.207510 type:complete len:210 (+) Transcript_90679:100-729(+)